MEFSHLIGNDHSVLSYYPNVAKKIIIRNEENNKYFVFDSYDEFEKWYNCKSIKYCHEIIFGNQCQRLKFDIDIKNNVKCSVENIIEYILEKILYTLNELYNCIYDFTINKDDFIITDSSGKEGEGYKYSYHIILYKYGLSNNFETKYITDEVIKNCDKYGQYIDKSVNKSIQNFRILGSNKKGSDRTKKITLKYGTHDGTLLDTLINIHENTMILEPLCSDNTCVDSFLDRSNKSSSSFQKIDSDVINEKILDLILSKCTSLDIHGHEIRCVVGNGIQFNRIKPTFCSICNEIHHNDNSLIINYDNITNNIYEFCRQAGKSRYLCNLYKVNKGIDLTQKSDDSTCKFSTLNNKNIYTADKMMPYEHVTNLAVKAQMKVGKTKALLEHVQKYYTHDSVIRFVTFRQTFSNHVYGMFNDFELYSNIKGNIHSHHKRIIIQVESLYRLSTETPVDLLILDEVESIFNQLGSGLHKNFNASFAMFMWLLRYSKHIICMDANLSNRTYNILTKFRTDPIFFHHNMKKSAISDKYYVTDDKNIWINHICEKLTNNKKIIIVTNSITEAKTCEYLVNVKYPDITVKMYSSEMTYSDKQTAFSDVHKYWSGLDVLIYTPTCSAGVSYELEHFDVIFGYFCDMSCDVETCRQMLYRVRNVKDKEYYICLQEVETVKLPTSVEELHGYIYNKRSNLLQLANDNNLQYLYDINGNIKFYDTDYYYIWLENMIIANLSKNDFIKRFNNQIWETGAVIKYLNKLDTESIHIEYTDAKNAVEELQNEIIASSRDLSIEEAIDISNKMSTQQDVEMKDFYSYEKYKLRSYYKYSNVIDKDFVKHYNKIDIKRIYKNLVNITACDTIEESMRKIIASQASRFSITVSDNTDYKNKLEHYDLRDDKRIYNALYHSIVSRIVESIGTSFIHEEQYATLIENIWLNIEKYKAELSIEYNIDFNKMKSDIKQENIVYDKFKAKIINLLLRNTYGLRIYKNNTMFKLKKCTGLATHFLFKPSVDLQFESKKVIIITNNILFLSLDG